MKRLFLLITSFLFTLPAYCQDEAVISGRVFDSTSKEPLPFANVTLNSKTDNKLLTGTVGAEDGLFTLAGIPEGEYTVAVSFLGYGTKEIPLLVGKLNKIFNLGKIELEQSPASLKEIEVSGQRDIVSANLDRKSFDIANNLSQAGSSALDAMRNLPGVTVDQEGKILLRGSDKVIVLIDGKQSSLTGFGNQQGLDNLPASNIERIDIINNPSAKYDARGMAGVVNIIYKKEQQKGFNGEAGFNFGVGELNKRRNNLPNIMDKYAVTPKYNPSLNLNYRANKVNLFFQGDGMVRKKVNANDFTTRDYTDSNPDIASQFLENRTQQLYNLKGGFDWFIDDRNTLTLFALFQDEYHIDRGHVPFDYIADGSRKRFWTWAEDENTRFINYAANYKHKFLEPGHEFGVGFLYTEGGEIELFPFTDVSATRNSTDETLLNVDEIISVFNADYVKPLRSGRLELGSKIQLRKIPISYLIRPGVNSVLDPNLGEWSEYNEDVYALYGNYLLETKMVDVEGGVRLEETTVNYKIDPANIYYNQNTAYDYLSLFPNVRFTYKINEKNGLSAFFNRRVDRPGEFELRPFPKYDDPEILKTGNPYLRPQFTNTFELAYKTFWNTGSVYLAGFQRYIDKIFSRIYTEDARASTTIINTIPQNLGNGTNLGFELTFDQKVNEKWDFNGSLNWYRNTINGFSGMSIYPYAQIFSFAQSKNNTWNLKLNTSIKLPWQTDFQATAVYYAPDIIPQGTIEERYSIDFGFKKNIIQNKAELRLSATDILNTFSIRRTFKGEGFNLISENYYETQVITLGMKYKF